MTPRVLVTGATGFVGQHLCESVTSWSSEVELVQHAPAEFIIDLAAATGMRETREEPRESFARSTSATLAALDAARHSPPRCFVHLSTDEQYGEMSGFGFTWGRLAPATPYAAAKIAQEAACHAYRHTYGVPVVVATADLVVGPGQPRSKVVPTMARAIIAGEPVPVFTTNGEPQVRRYSTVANLVDLLRWLLGHPELRSVAVPGERMSTAALAERIGHELGLPVRMRFIERPDLRHSAGWGREPLEWRAPESFAAGLRSTLGSLLA